MSGHRIILALLLVAGAFTVANGMRAPDTDRQPSAPGVSASRAADPVARKQTIAVAFLLDRELTRGMYLGERWVSPPSYFFAQEGMQYVVQAKAQNIDSHGERIDISGNWIPSDGSMISVAHGKASEVTIIVYRPGQSDLTVTTGSGSKVLHFRARQVAGAMQVDITQ